MGKFAKDATPYIITVLSAIFSQLACLALPALPCGVITIGGRPPTRDAGLAGQHLISRIAVLVCFLKRHWPRTDNRHPFC